MQNFQEFMTQALAEAGLTDEQVTSALGKLYSNEKLSPKLNALVKTATEDYNAQLGRVKAAEDKVAQYNRWYEEAKTSVASKQKEYEDALAMLTNTNNVSNGNAAFDESKYLPKADILKLMEERDARWGAVIKDGLAVATRHAVEFKEPLDVEALGKLAQEKGIGISEAYEQMVRPRLEKMQQEKHAAELKAAKEEGYKDALSRHKLPVDPTPAETAPIFTRVAKDQVPGDILGELQAAWNSVK